MENLFAILQEHGYTGPNEIISILHWFEVEHKIYFQVTPVWDEDEEGNDFWVGYQGIIFIAPYENQFNMQPYNSLEELYYAMFIQVISMYYV